MDLTILVKNSKYKSHEDLVEEGRKELLKLFGIEPDFWKRLKTGKRKSELLTKEQIAQILLNNSLVNSLEEGLNEVDEIIDKGGFHYSISIESKRFGDELKYQFRYHNSQFHEAYARVIID